MDRLLDGVEWCVDLQGRHAATRPFDAWLVVQKALEPRVDVAVGFIQIPAGSRGQRSRERAHRHRAPQPAADPVPSRPARVVHLDERAIFPSRSCRCCSEHLPVERRPARASTKRWSSLEPYRRLIAAFVEGQLPEERFQWAYLERLAKEAVWRDDETFALLNSLFENQWGRDVRAARLVALEFQGQLAGRLEPLKARAARLLEQLD